MLLTALLIVLVAFVGLGAYLEYSVYREVTTNIEILNAEGAKTALVLYHPGLTVFAHDVAYNFSQGLASVDWRVEIATASPQAPTDVSNYSLLVLCWPIYDFNPGPTITNQIHRIGDLRGIRTVIVVVAGGLDPLNAPANMEKIVHDANGTVTQTIKAYRGNHLNMQQQASQIMP